jgi:pilus assembly protein Flp/PilA
MLSQVKALINDQDGATAIEYGLIAGLIAVAIITAITAVGTDLSGMFNGIATKVVAATPSS